MSLLLPIVRIASIAIVLNAVGLTRAWACDGQVGKVIFEDKFEDDSGGWETASIVSIKPPEMLITPTEKTTGSYFNNSTFNATDGDYCIEATLPKPGAPENELQVGLHIWVADDNNYTTVKLGGSGDVTLGNVKGSSYREVFAARNFSSFKADDNAVNALRIVAKDGRLTVYLNNVLVKAVRAQTPTTSTSFGIVAQYADSDKADAKTPRTVHIKSYKVTTGS